MDRLPILDRLPSLTSHVLPHRAPMILVDRVLGYEPDCWVRARKLVSINDPLMGKDGTLSPLLLVEAIAQTGAILYCASGRQPQLLGVEKASFPEQARAGDELVLYAETLWLKREQVTGAGLGRVGTGLGKARGTAHRGDGILLCQLEFSFALVAIPPLEGPDSSSKDTHEHLPD